MYVPFSLQNPLLLDIPEKDENIDDDDDVDDACGLRKAVLLRLVGAFLVVLSIVLIVVVIYLDTKTPEVKYCHFDDDDHVTPRNLENPDVFDDLSEDELTAVNDFMLKDQSLGITPWNKATVDSSYIYMIELHLPNKNDVLQHLDHGSKKPKRQAKVVVVRGNRKPPVVEEYIVSPLSKSRTATIYMYKDPSYIRDPIPYESRPIDGIDNRYLFAIIAKATEELYPLLMESYRLCYHNCTTGVNRMAFSDISPGNLKRGDRKSWIQGLKEIDGVNTQPLGLSFLIDHKSTNVSKWRIEKIVYNGQEYASVELLMDAYKTKTLKMIHFKFEKSYSYDTDGEKHDTNQQGPKLFEPGGKRFKVNGRRILYNKWTFNIHMKPSIGLQIFDIRFDGTRIAYEISLQEVLVIYSAYWSPNASTSLYGTSSSIGASSISLVRGVDCPDTSVFLNTYFWVNTGRPVKGKGNICVFEQNGGIPQRRHFSTNYKGGYYYSGIADYHLVVRTIATVWNADYLFDYIFYPDGAIEVKAANTGYVRYGSWEEYGNPIHDHVIANLHQHLFNYKIDIDIAGVRNRYTILDIRLENVTHPMYMDGTQMKIVPTLIHTEKEAIRVDPSQTPFLLFHNKDAKNPNGRDRSYRIVNKGQTDFLLKDAPFSGAAQWAKYPVVVTRRQDTEISSTSIYAQNYPFSPVLNFNDFIDSYSIVDTDLVAWVTMGAFHVPGTEAVPSTSTTWNRYSFILQPYNYFSECPTKDSPDEVVIRPGKEKGKPEVKGFDPSPVCIPKTVGPFDFDGHG